MYINTNVSALFAENSLMNTQNTLQNLQQEMSTGYKINSPANNPSGLAISNLMQGELGGINSAISNATGASNLLNTANGGMQTDMQIVQQIQQLAVQASNTTNNAQDSQDIQTQIKQLLSSLDNVSQTLNYNNQFVLSANSGPSTSGITAGGTIAAVQVGADSGNIAASSQYSVAVSYTTANGGSDVVSVTLGTGSGSVVAAGTISNLSGITGNTTLQLVKGQNSNKESFAITVNQASIAALTTGSAASTAFTVAAGTQLQFQTGPNQGNGNSITTSFGAFTSATLGLNNLSVTNTQNAQYAITQAQSALSILTNAQGTVGAQIDQINYTMSNLQTESTNLQASKSSIMDANMATVTSQFAQQQILLQTGLQSLSAANSLPGMVLKLLG